MTESRPKRLQEVGAACPHAGLSFAILIAGLFLLVSPRLHAAEKVEAQLPLDPVTGMKMTGDWELARNHCIACHSPQTFLRQKGTLSTWTEIIRWMQKDGGLPPLQVETESKILAYLSKNYGPGEEHRRAPIPATLMPTNPYVSDAKKQFEQSRK